MNKILKQYLPEALVVVMFALMSFLYFYPADVENRVLNRHDSAAAKSLGHEISEHLQQTGETSRWTDALFCGMPTYQIAPAYDSAKPLSTVTTIYHLGLPNYVWYLFAYLLGFYILLRAFDFKWYLAALGSVIWALSSYFLIIIAAGHFWKVMALAYLPPMIGGIWLSYKGKYLWGFIVTALFTAMEINANHVQMTYYYLFIIFFMVVALLVEAIKNKTLKRWCAASAVCAAAALIGVLMNISNLYHTWEYQNETMRAQSELTKKDSSKSTGSGLDRDYITQWSYGGDELLTLMIPNANGGSSDIRMGENEDAMAKIDPSLDPQLQEVIATQLPQYWGEQPYTAGPVYVGAFVVFLFILSIFYVKGALKWALWGVTVLSILLSLGHNLQWFTDLFIDHMPMYNKFRTVSSILVIAEFTMPLLAMLTIKRIYDEPGILGLGKDAVITNAVKRNRIFFVISLLLTAGVCLFIATFPDVMPHLVSSGEQEALQNAGLLELLRPSLVEARKAILTADCMRSFWIIIIGVVIIILFMLKKINGWIMAGALTVLCLVDMWQVDKRYLNDDMFVNVAETSGEPDKSPADEEILKDKELGYRVLNLSVSTFNDNTTSYYHRSIGGYHAAKLRRYQELIDNHLSPEIGRLTGNNNNPGIIYETYGDLSAANPKDYQVLNMLNMKYLIVPTKEGLLPLQNPNAFGPAWFVDEVKYVEDANKEIETMRSVDLRHVAVSDKKFEKTLGKAVAQDSLSTAVMTSYAPNHVEYDCKSATGGVLVISEVYYPGWKATIDGKEVELGRVNYVLRALHIDAGNHKVVLDFHPTTIESTETAAYIAMVILLLAVIAAIVLTIKPDLLRRKK